MKLQVIKTKNILPKEDLNKKKREKRYKRREEEKKKEQYTLDEREVLNAMLLTDYNGVLANEKVSKYAETGSITGQCGSGKSGTSIANHVNSYNKFDRLPIHIVPKSGLVKSMLKSIQSFNKTFQETAKRMGKKVRPIKGLYAKELGFSGYEDEDRLGIRNHLDIYYKPNFIPIVMSICHPTQLEKLLSCVVEKYNVSMGEDEEYNMRGLNLTFDESHKTLNKNKQTINFDREDISIDNPASWENARLNAYELVIHLQHFPDSQVICMSATLFQDYLTKPIEFIIQVQPNKRYISLEDTLVEYILPLEKGVNSQDDPELWRIVEKLSKLEHYPKKKYGLIKDHPTYLLIQSVSTHEGMKQVAEKIHRDFPDKFCTITNTCKGYTVKFNKAVSKLIREEHNGKIKIDDGTDTDTSSINSNNTLEYNCKMDVSSVLQICSDYSQYIPRLILIGNQRISEGTRINSDDFFLASTHGFNRFPVTMTGDNRVQSFSRSGCGIKMIRPTNYCEESAHESVLVTHRLNQDSLKVLIEKTSKNTVDRDCDTDDCSCDPMTSLEILKNSKVSTQRLRGYKVCKADITMEETSDLFDDFGDAKSITKTDDIMEKNETKSSKKRRRLAAERDEEAERDEPENLSNDIRLIIASEITSSQTKKIYLSFFQFKTC